MILDLKDISVNYGAIRALHGVSFGVQAGSIVTLIGCNGAGKSTILRAISGLLRPSSGSIHFEGDPIHGLAPHKIVSRGIVHVPEGRGIFTNMSLAENLSLGAYQRRDKPAIAEDTERALSLFPRLRERYHQSAGTLSGGEQQMLAIARALMARPRLLLLDEPSLGLAPQVVQTIFKIIRQINAEGTTILLVEQNAHMALEVAHEAFVFDVGRVVMSGRAKDLATSDEVRKRYLGVA